MFGRLLEPVQALNIVLCYALSKKQHLSKLVLCKVTDLHKDCVKKMSIGELFERFCNEQILKNYDLFLEEIEDGITDGSNDGGIDAIYLFANGGILKDIEDLELLKRESTIEMYIIISKHDSIMNIFCQ